MAKKKYIESPDRFYELFAKYKQWAKENPRKENVFSQKLGTAVAVDRERPLTWTGFDTWLYKQGVISDSEDYRLNTDGRYDSYKGVITRVNKEMQEDKFTGAAVGIYNANIIARDLGLADKKEHSGQISLDQITGMEIS